MSLGDFATITSITYNHDGDLLPVNTFYSVFGLGVDSFYQVDLTVTKAHFLIKNHEVGWIFKNYFEAVLIAMTLYSEPDILWITTIFISRITPFVLWLMMNRRNNEYASE